MFRTANAGLKTLCNLRALRGSYLVEYSTKVTLVVYGNEMMGGGAMRKVVRDFLSSWVYYVKVQRSLISYSSDVRCSIVWPPLLVTIGSL